MQKTNYVIKNQLAPYICLFCFKIGMNVSVIPMSVQSASIVLQTYDMLPMLPLPRSQEFRSQYCRGEGGGRWMQAVEF